MKKYVFYLLTFLFVLSACSKNYEKEIVGWWLSEDATRYHYVGYIINENGKYTKRMKSTEPYYSFDGTDKGRWKVKGSRIFFYVDTYNGKKQHNRIEAYEIYYLKDSKLILKSGDEKFCYVKDE